jgi:hypothetical protein
MTAPPSDAARAILRYFLRNPSAADDAEGIAQWRLLEQDVIDTLNETIEALVWLAANGYLTVRDRPGRPPLFQLNATSSAAARSLIDGGQETPR